MRQVKALARMLAALAVLLAATQLGCSTSGGGGDDAGTTVDPVPDAGEVDAGDAGPGPKVKVGYLEACESNDDCLSDYCLPSKKCSKACVKREECPAPNGWQCAPAGGADLRCTCVPSSDTETCDGFDNNCDGQADEGARCEGAAVCQSGKCTCPAENLCGTDCVDRKTDVHHCGTCEKSCGTNEICNGGQCQCPGRVCGGRCIDTQYDSQNCGDCNKACAAGEECADSVCRPMDREWASWTVRGVSLLTSEGDAVRDQTTGLLWTSQLSENPVDQPTAAAYCDGLDLAGFTDWRLPTRIELLSIVHFGYSMPAMDPGTFPDALPGAVWTATASASEPGKAWAVNFQDGTVSTYQTAAPFYVRCVR